VHLARRVDADYDAAVAYARQGNALLLDGTYPSSEYPSGAVVLFGFEALIGEGSTRVSHALAMVPFQLSVVAAVWLVGTRSSRWFAAVIALWPLNAFFWEFKFGLVPTTFLVLGLVFASRARWLLAGALLGVGAATKWTPALTVLALVLWLLGSKRWRPAAAHAAGAAAAFLVVNIPFLVWSAREMLNAYTFQGQRGLIGDSFAYIPLRLLGKSAVERRALGCRSGSGLGERGCNRGADGRAARQPRRRRDEGKKRGRSDRHRGDGSGCVPHLQPGLQPAVPRADRRRVGGGRVASGAERAGPNSCSEPSSSERRSRTSSCTRHSRRLGASSPRCSSCSRLPLPAGCTSSLHARGSIRPQRGGESSSTSLAPNAPPDVNRAGVSAREAPAR
jgi:hypothetical protein